MVSIINPIIQSVASYEPIMKSLLTGYGIVKNYQRDKKLEYHDKELALIKEKLGLNTYSISDDELKVINTFLIQSEQIDRNLKLVDINFENLKKETNFKEERLKEILLNLESEEFINITRIPNSKEYKLNYSIFYKSNLIEKMYSNSISYFDILNIIIDKLLNTDSDSSDMLIYVDKFIEKHSLNSFLINPIIVHFELLNIIKESHLETGSCILVKSYICIDKAKLIKYNKQLLNKI